MELEISVFSSEGTVAVSWLSSVDSLLTIWWLYFWFYLYQTTSHIFGMGLRWWARHYLYFGIETFLCVSIHIGGMASSCFGGINLAFVSLPYSMTFDNLPKILLGHFLLIHFRFLLSLVNYFSILLSVSSALLSDIFWLSLLVCRKWNCFLSLWWNVFWAVSGDVNYRFYHLIILHFCRWYM